MANLAGTNGARAVPARSTSEAGCGVKHSEAPRSFDALRAGTARAPKRNPSTDAVFNGGRTPAAPSVVVVLLAGPLG